MHPVVAAAQRLRDALYEPDEQVNKFDDVETPQDVRTKIYKPWATPTPEKINWFGKATLNNNTP